METQQQTSSASLSREEVKTLGLSSLGGILEFYDFIIVFPELPMKSYTRT